MKPNSDPRVCERCGWKSSPGATLCARCGEPLVARWHVPQHWKIIAAAAGILVFGLTGNYLFFGGFSAAFANPAGEILMKIGCILLALCVSCGIYLVRMSGSRQE